MTATRSDCMTVGALSRPMTQMMVAPPSLEGANWMHDVIIGYGFMKDFVVTFDYPGRRITLAR
jgi:hypothetical protein